jgi:hypothetical protein
MGAQVMGEWVLLRLDAEGMGKLKSRKQKDES